MVVEHAAIIQVLIKLQDIKIVHMTTVSQEAINPEAITLHKEVATSNRTEDHMKITEMNQDKYDCSFYPNLIQMFIVPRHTSFIPHYGTHILHDPFSKLKSLD